MNLKFHEEAWKIWLTDWSNRKVCFHPSDAAKEWVQTMPAEEQSIEINKAIECYLLHLSEVKKSF